MKKTNQNWIIAIGLSGALAVTLGAFGAHALAGKLSEVSLDNYKTAVNYHFIHTIAALIAFYFYHQSRNKLIGLAFKLFILGIILFSGSLYLLSTRSIMQLDSMAPVLGPITPLGGLTFIAAWILLGIGSYKYIKHENI